MSRNVGFAPYFLRSALRCGRNIRGCLSSAVTRSRHPPATVFPPCQGLCQTVVPSTQYDPQSHKNGESAQKPDNSGHLFKYIHSSFLLFVFDFGQRCKATPLLITATDQSAFFVNPIQDSHTLVFRIRQFVPSVMRQKTSFRRRARNQTLESQH